MVRWGRVLADAQPRQTDPLAGLIDFPLPQEVSLWPQTWPLRVAIVLIAAGGLLATWRFVHRFYADKYRREALAELEEIRGTVDAAPAEVATRLSVLVRRTALGAFRREAVAPLSGPAWLAFLDRSYDGKEFSEGAGRLLISAPYQRRSPDRDQLEALASLVRRWIGGHHV
jgi:hypothetical protein